MAGAVWLVQAKWDAAWRRPANMMYFGVLLVGFIGVIIARLEPQGMSGALFATAFAMALVPVIALVIGAPAFANGVVAVFALHAFFAMLFVGSALLFRKAGRKQPPAVAGLVGWTEILSPHFIWPPR